MAQQRSKVSVSLRRV